MKMVDINENILYHTIMSKNSIKHIIPKTSMNGFKKTVVMLLVTVIIIASLPISTEAVSVKNEYKIYKVTTSANMRESAAKSGKWITVIPAGVYVAVVDFGENSYYHVKYGEYDGYAYMYCLVEMTDKTYSDYIAQFPNLVEESSVSTVTQLGSLNSSMGAMALTDNNTQSESAPVPVTVTGTVTTRAKFRNAPSVTAEELNALPQGATVTILESGENGFLHVSYQGQEGFVYARLVEYDSSANLASGVLDTVVVDDITQQNTRKSTSTSAAMSSSLTAQRRTAAVNASQALTGATTTTAVASASTVAASTEDETVEIETPETINIIDTSHSATELAEMVVSYSMNMRSLPDRGSNQIGNIPAGATVTVLGSTQGGYTMVQYNGVIGYVLDQKPVEHVNTAVVADGTAVLYTVTAYCSCRICCGQYSPEVTGRVSHTATGTVPEEGRTIAVDPSMIPYGTSVYIDGYGTYIAEDCGGAIRGNRIDMYFESHEAALQFGVRRLYVTIVN